MDANRGGVGGPGLSGLPGLPGKWAQRDQGQFSLLPTSPDYYQVCTYLFRRAPATPGSGHGRWVEEVNITGLLFVCFCFINRYCRQTVEPYIYSDRPPVLLPKNPPFSPLSPNPWVSWTRKR